MIFRISIGTFFWVCVVWIVVSRTQYSRILVILVLVMAFQIKQEEVNRNMLHMNEIDVRGRRKRVAYKLATERHLPVFVAQLEQPKCPEAHRGADSVG